MSLKSEHLQRTWKTIDINQYGAGKKIVLSSQLIPTPVKTCSDKFSDTGLKIAPNHGSGVDLMVRFNKWSWDGVRLKVWVCHSPRPALRARSIPAATRPPSSWHRYRYYILYVYSSLPLPLVRRHQSKFLFHRLVLWSVSCLDGLFRYYVTFGGSSLSQVQWDFYIHFLYLHKVMRAQKGCPVLYFVTK